MVKMVHIVGGDLYDGAARGAYWLHQGLLDIGVESKMIIQKASGNELFVEPVAKNVRGTIMRLFRIFLDLLPVLLYRKRENVLFSTGISGFDIRKTDMYLSADIIHLHWINNGMINIRLLKKIEKPIVWTMRDMWPFTGGCHYALGCERYQTGCGSCPQLKSKNNFDLSWYVLKRKKHYYPKNMQLVGISKWLTECAKQSDVFRKFNIRMIHNNINTKVFFPVDRQVARDVLGLPKEKKIVLMGAADHHMKHKGFEIFQKAVRCLKEKYLFMFLGHVDRHKLEGLNIEYEVLGYLHDNISVRLAYSAADAFVAPSIQEAFGKTLAEAMACGIPVVAFDATGPQDIIDHKKNGYLAKPFDPEDLAYGIEWVIEDESRYKVLSLRAREKAEQEFGSEKVAKEYLQLYNELLAKKIIA